ncbi:tRNA (adenine(58)-N(1))-methyltransferase non-catalytic subunit Trm6p [[Candida] railenensis]|uniref:tRNA (adenine(58)-N(1))-methyltransferase non-catalytic subunit TRM6 n=1 Tax=[Candida] railenensis TaxID=45579 RepID=A0A9P0QJT1_9ASCO|nr:tRNA (adenine(58)-N(1))-methyltransferase non-catalytic subunit Trm6p [[Candida] railenensis]
MSETPDPSPNVTPAFKAENEVFAPKSSTIISPNQFAFVRLPSEGMKIVELKPGGIINLGKFGAFAVDGVLGYPFGQTFEILDDNQVTPIESITYEADISEDVELSEGGAEAAGPELTKDELTKLFTNSSENNQNIINIGSSIQKLSSEEIDSLKKSGASSDFGQKIIEQIIAGHAGFDKKTIFSQQKYLKRKQQKFLRRFTMEYLGSSQLLKYYIEKDSQRVLDMSEETLGLLLNYANVRQGGRYLLVDETGGVVLYAMMERMKGQGTIVVAHDNEHPNHIALRYSNYQPSMVEDMVKPINWLQFMEPENERIDWVTATEDELNDMKFAKRQQYERRSKRAQEVNSVIDQVTTGNFDAVIVVSTLNLPSLVPHLIGTVGGSRPIVLYHQYKESLLDTQHSLSNDKRVLAPSIFETRVRPHQTIPGRMHPVMSMRGFGGYILWATRVFPKEGGVTAVGRGVSKKKKDEEAKVEEKDVVMEEAKDDKA